MNEVQYAAFETMLQGAAKARGESEENKAGQVFLLGLLVTQREPLPTTDEERSERVFEVESKAAETGMMMGLLAQLTGELAMLKQASMMAVLAFGASVANAVAGNLPKAQSEGETKVDEADLVEFDELLPEAISEETTEDEQSA